MTARNRSDVAFDVINNILLSIVLAIVLYPLIYILSSSISDPLKVNSGEVWLLPKGVTFEGYLRVLRDSKVWMGYRNTIFYTIVGTIINLLVTITCAYPLSRRDFNGRNVLTAIFTFTMFFSGGLIPTYLLIKNLNMVDTVWALLIPGAAGMWNIVVTRTFIQTSIPFELQESAKIDGCSDIGIFLKIILPLSPPIIAVMALFYGVGHWNAFFNALIYISNSKLYPLQLILREILIQNQFSASMMANGDNVEAMAEQAKLAELIKFSVIIVSSLPVLIVYPFLQRYFVKGVMVGAIKG